MGAEQYRPTPTSPVQTRPVHVIGGGMAGVEAAWALAGAGVPAVLHEMRPMRGTAAHQTDGLAELVCSNSFRSDDAESNAVGVLHEEMRRAGSLQMAVAAEARTPAGGALAVDRELFSRLVTARIEAHPLIEIRREEVDAWPPAEWDSVIIATGPLTSPALASAIAARTGEDSLAFFDAIAPIIYAESVDMEIAWAQSRYDKGETPEERAAYLNCPLDRAQYERFIDGLLDGEKTEFKDWERDTPYFEGCLPIEVMAERGRETLRYGPLKPVGLTNPHRPEEKPYAVVQLRQDNKSGTLFNIVGFQTKLKYGAQKEVFRRIPGLEGSEFARLGGIHRNTFLNSPRLLDGRLRLRAEPRLRFAGQITGVEGYVESAAMGILAGRFAAAERLGRAAPPPPLETAFGALLHHVTAGAEAATFQPMNVNFGLFPALADPPRGGRRGKRDRARAYAARALAACDAWLSGEAATTPDAALTAPEPDRAVEEKAAG
ncbi:MAG: methylenetetrahydrofolate--tRNA-(uracil(54)-C(5))-methyltransferase (FADH(2)-oxidizing) TrmFO [Pseudomonadota bacterium]